MPRNVEMIQEQFGSKNPLPSIELANNALKLGGYPANLYVLKGQLGGEVEILLSNIEEVLKALTTHEQDDVRHLTDGQIKIIQSAIDATEALRIANEAIREAGAGVESEAVQTAVREANAYTDQQIKNKLGSLNLPAHNDPVTGEMVEQDMADALEKNPQNLINPEYFYRFKNMIDNSSFEVYNGNTLRPIGWDGGVVSDDASMFETHSLKLVAGESARQTPKHQADASWMRGAYDTDDVVLCFYHKFDAVDVGVYDVANQKYLMLTELDASLKEQAQGTKITFPYEANWNQYRCMVKFTPASNTKAIRVEFKCAGGRKGECYIDAPSMEPYVAGEYPSIYKHGRFSSSAYQLLNPPPDEVDRFTPFEHLNIVNGIADDKGNLTYQEYTRADGTLAIKREASNPDANGYYQTFVETFYNRDGSIHYIDTYTYTYSKTGAILSKVLTTTEEV